MVLEYLFVYLYIYICIFSLSGSRVRPTHHTCVMGMCGARSAVFVRTGRVLSITSQATRNLFVLEVSTGTVTCCFNSLFTGMYRVGMNVPLKTNRTNKYVHVHICHGHVLAQCAMFMCTGARVVYHFPCN